MKRISTILLGLSMLLAIQQTTAQGDTGYPETDELTPQEQSMLAYLWEEEKHLRDIFLTGAGCSDNPEFASAAIAKQEHMDLLKGLLHTYGLEVPAPGEEVGVFTDSFEIGVWSGWGYACVNPDFTIAAQATMYGDRSIWNLLKAMDQTDKQRLLDAYNYLLVESCDHLRLFAAYLPGKGDATYLSRDLFDQILAGTFPSPSSEGFTMNAGLNDAWYYPATDGQGFFITVFPDLALVSLAWFTYDTELPPIGATANLGDPGHRWLTAVGPIEGNEVLMDIEMTSGGIFDTATDIQRTDPPGSDGTILLTFDSCNSGTVEYDIPSINRQGIVPIQRVANDNIVLCEALNSY